MWLAVSCTVVPPCGEGASAERWRGRGAVTRRVARGPVDADVMSSAGHLGRLTVARPLRRSRLGRGARPAEASRPRHDVARGATRPPGWPLTNAARTARPGGNVT